MHKTVVGSCVAVLLLAAPNAFAQFKNPVKAAKNLANLDRIVTAAAQKASRGEIVAWVPARFVPSGKVLLQPVQMPIVRTPVTASLLHKIPASANALHVKALASQFIMGAYGEHGYGKAFYEDQTELARDLVAFYDGKLETRIGPDGHEVNLLALPVDGIVYKPAGYRAPVVLNSKDYFVIYDVAAQTGKIADNVPAVYKMYKPAGEEEIYGEFEYYEVEPGIESWRPKDPEQYYRWNRNLMRDNPWRAEDWRNGNYPSRFESQDDLGNALHRFYGNDVPKVQKRFSKDAFNVYELPVSGLVYQGEGQLEPTVLVPSSYVVLYNENTGGQIVQRSDLENSFFFEFVK